MNSLDVVRDVLVNVLPGAVVTAKIALGAWIVSAIIGLVLAVVRDTNRPILTLPVGAAVGIIRCIPQLVILYMIYFGVGAFGIGLDSLTAAIVGLGIAEAVFTAEYYRAGLMTVKTTQRDAGVSLGLSHLQLLRLVVIPQAIPFVVPPLLNSFLGLMKSATIAVAVGAPEILYQGQSYSERTGLVLPVALTVMVLYLIVTIPLSKAVWALERRARATATA